MPEALQILGNAEKYLFFGVFVTIAKLKNLCPKKLKLGLPRNIVILRNAVFGDFGINTQTGEKPSKINAFPAFVPVK